MGLDNGFTPMDLVLVDWDKGGAVSVDRDVSSAAGGAAVAAALLWAVCGANDGADVVVGGEACGCVEPSALGIDGGDSNEDGCCGRSASTRD